MNRDDLKGVDINDLREVGVDPDTLPYKSKWRELVCRVVGHKREESEGTNNDWCLRCGNYIDDPARPAVGVVQKNQMDFEILIPVEPVKLGVEENKTGNDG